MVDKIREIILRTLYNINEKGAYSNIALNNEIKQKSKTENPINSRDLGFITEIVYGTISWKLTIDEIIKKYSKIQIEKISPWILNILRMSIYQIVFLDKIPKSAAVNEGVNLAKKYGHRGSANFANAILRKVEKEDYEEFFEIKNDIERISKTTSMPEWVVEKLLKERTKEEVEEICKNSNIRPKIYIRINTLKTNKQELKNELKKLKIKVKETKLEDFLEVKGLRNLENLQIFKQGYFTIQDIQAGEIPIILEPKPNQKILDACSSPGGKTTYIAQLMQNKGEIVAWDLHKNRVELVKEAAERLGIHIIKTEEKDASEFDEKYAQYFDKILLDVPCMGLGVLKRKPDIKWQRNAENLEEITKTQAQILQNCAKYLKPGGEIVYSTCSILEEENEKIIKSFVTFVTKNEKEKNNFEIEKMMKTYQNEEKDGFFICKIIKK